MGQARDCCALALRHAAEISCGTLAADDSEIFRTIRADQKEVLMHRGNRRSPANCIPLEIACGDVLGLSPYHWIAQQRSACRKRSTSCNFSLTSRSSPIMASSFSKSGSAALATSAALSTFAAAASILTAPSSAREAMPLGSMIFANSHWFQASASMLAAFSMV